MAIRYCKAHSKRTGQPCKARAVTNSNVCYHHGGKSPSGIDSPSWKTGKYSKFRGLLTGTDLEHYQRAIEDDRYIELREELGISNLLVRHAVSLAFNADGEAELKKWARERLEALLDGHRKLAEAERKRIVDAERMVPMKQVTATIAMIAAIVLEEAEQHPEMRARIARRITERIGRGSSGDGSGHNPGDAGTIGYPFGT